MRQAAFLSVALSAMAALAATAAASMSPAALYSALLHTAFAKSELPSGFATPSLEKLAPSANGKHYHVVGEVQVSVAGPDAADAIGYYVFPTAADARGDFLHPSRGGETVKSRGKVPGMTLPSWEITGSLNATSTSGQRVTVGETGMAVLSGNVIVTSASVVTSSKTRGNAAHALALLKAGLAHLSSVEH